MSDYLIFLSETISAETGRDFDAIAREVAAVLDPISYEARNVYGIKFSSRYTY